MIMLLSIFATTQEHNLTTNQEHNFSTAAFLFYAALVITVTFILIFHFIPLYGQTHIMVYIGVYSLIGSITVMSVKALGIVIKLTMSGMNQLIYPQTWAFSLVVIVCVLTQMNYLNKAVDTFNAAVVSPIYYVMFTAFTIVASVIMFKGFIAYALNYGLITW
ncbi:putative magnesium transporter NIPA4 [Glycine soja]|uniref:Probable magnesium transporter n=2 Tax=Glycine subgen. Soja TaxID=1462606 RepID=A0A0R0EYV3_SOYBN|nr:putative magnesium transporter NIPA4 [Glycine soja]